jgi:serine/threonine protein kinase
MDFMHGGSLLGKGSYGCVFRPPLLCKSKQGQSYRITGDLTKISTQRDADREYRMGHAVRAIPLSPNYFLPVLEECEVAPKQTDEDIDECDIVDDNPISKLRLLSMKYGGESMSQMDIKRFKTAADFWKFGKHLLEGAALLSVNGIIHRDLHRGNVLVDTYMVGRIIDFGISIKYNDDIDTIQKCVKQFKDKLKKFRISGLQKGGEMSLENLVFKVLRRNGYIDKLYNVPTTTIDNKLSMTERKN